MKRVLMLLVAAALLASGLYAATAVAGSHSAKSGHVTICHRTGSHHNPYVVISPSAAGVLNGHYTQHNEHAVFPNTASDGKWGDIIPPFQYNGVTYSLNWDAAGQAIWSNGCQPATTGTTTAAGSTTTVTSTGATTTVTNQGSTVTVTTPGSTVTVTTPVTTTTFTPPPHKKHHKKRHHRQTFIPPKFKLPHTL